MNNRLRRSARCVLVAMLAVPPAIATSGLVAAETSNTSEESDAQAAQATALALSWFPLGGPYWSPPQVLPDEHLAGDEAVLEIGFDDNAYVHIRDGGVWSEAIWLDGLWTSVVVPAVTVKGLSHPYAEAFGVGYDSAVWYGREDVDGWQSLGGTYIYDPTAVTFQGVTYVFGVGSDNAVWYRSPTSGWYSLGGILTSTLSATTDGTNLYISGLGQDDALWTNTLSPSLTWSGWNSLGGVLVTYTASTFQGNTGYVFGIGEDFAVWYQSVTAGSWSGWQSIGGLAFSPPAAAAAANGEINAFVIGDDLAMYRQRLSGGTWSGWQHLGGAFISAPGASSSQAFGIGLDDNLWVADL